MNRSDWFWFSGLIIGMTFIILSELGVRRVDLGIAGLLAILLSLIFQFIEMYKNGKDNRLTKILSK